MDDSPREAMPATEADRVNRRFAGVGVALGLVFWVFVFTLPGIVAASVVGRSHPRLGAFLGFLGMLMVVPGALWLGKSAWGAGWRKGLPLAPVGPGVLGWTLAALLAFLLVEFAFIGTVARTVGLPDLPDPLPTVGLLGLVLGAPLGEELLFRGYGLARIRELGGERRAVLLTALVFALAHVHLVKLPGTFVIGLLLGWLVLRTGSLWPSLLAHGANNAIAAILAGLGPAPVMDPAQASWTLILGCGSIGVASLALLGSPLVRDRIRGLSGPLSFRKRRGPPEGGPPVEVDPAY